MINYVEQGEVYFISADLINSKTGDIIASTHGPIVVDKEQSSRSFIKDVENSVDSRLRNSVSDDTECIFKLLSMNKIGSARKNVTL